MAQVARSVSEWHTRMTAEKLNQSGQPLGTSKYPVGGRVSFSNLSSKQEADSKGRRSPKGETYWSLSLLVCRTSEIDKAHWHQISTTWNKSGQLLLKKSKAGDLDATMPQRAVIGTQIHTGTNTPIQGGEYVIIKDGPLATTWYCAEISRIEKNWI